MLLICLMMVGYEAFRKFSNQVTHTLIIGAPFSAVTVNTDTQPLSLDNVQVGVPDMDENESILEEIILPEILYKIPPKVAKVVSISNINSGNNIHSVVDVRQSSVRKGSKSHSSSSVSSSQQRKNGDDELVDEEGNEAGTTDHLPHDSIATLATTDDNVEQILRPKEIHSKLLGMATEDFKQSALHEEQHRYHSSAVMVVPPPFHRYGRAFCLLKLLWLCLHYFQSQHCLHQNHDTSVLVLRAVPIV